MTTVSERHVAFLAVEPKSGERGGAEAFHEGFCSTLREHGWKVDKIQVGSDESSFERILETYLYCYDLDVSQYDMVISSKAPSYAVRHPRHLCYLQHTIRVFYDMFDVEFAAPDEMLNRQRERIQALDTALLAPQRVARIFTNGDETLRRLRHYNGLDGEVLYPGLLRDHFHPGRFDNYLFLPGRLHRWKRIGLLVDAMHHVESDIELRIAGTGEDFEAFVKRAASDPRIRFLGRISDQECVEQYANALAVPFVPLMEDFGYITLEAFRSSKPVITCSDSGTPVDLVSRANAGVVADPTPDSIASAIDSIAANHVRAYEMGERGRQLSQSITWNSAVKQLMQSASDAFFH
jgi:glycosyltransferase involved in cell wall biosynthesis